MDCVHFRNQAREHCHHRTRMLDCTAFNRSSPEHEIAVVMTWSRVVMRFFFLMLATIFGPLVFGYPNQEPRLNRILSLPSLVQDSKGQYTS